MIPTPDKTGQSRLKQFFTTAIIILLTLSFFVWGLSDLFRSGDTRNEVARVGSTVITGDTMRAAYQSELARLVQRARRPISPAQARAFGLDAQVLGRLVSEATLDENAIKLGLSVTDEAVAKTIMEDPVFRGADGTFSRARFQELLSANNLTEQAFVEDQKRLVLRRQITQTLSSGIDVPAAMSVAIHQYGTENRAVSYVVLSPASVVDIPQPDAATLQHYFEERKSAFRTPERRSARVLPLVQEALMQPDALSEADLKARYEEVKAARYALPERRHVQQIVFPSLQEAQVAVQSLKDGRSFETLAKERGLDTKDFDLGVLTRAEILDNAVADAAFSLKNEGVSAPIQGSFGGVLVRIAGIEPAHIKPYDEVLPELRQSMARENARQSFDALRDRIEDARSNAKSLSAIAQEVGQPLLSIDAVDRTGHNPAGVMAPGLGEREALLTALFSSEVGVENDPLRTSDGGMTWYEVTRVEPSRARSLEEARDDAEKAWRADEMDTRLRAQAQALVTRIDGGEAFETIAADTGTVVQTARGLDRGSDTPALPRMVVAQVFSTPLKRGGSAAQGENRIVFQVTEATTPPFDPASATARTLNDRLKTALEEDVLSQYAARLQTEYGFKLNQTAFRSAVGGE